MTGPRTRREFLVGSGAAVLSLALPAAAWSRLRTAAAAHGGSAAREAWSFVSEPDLKPPAVNVTTSNGVSPGCIFVASLNGPGQRGPLILDRTGRVVWFHPVDTVAINFRSQVFEGKPVLTWWEGQISKIGTGQGEGVIVDETYATVARVRAGNGLQADVHELLLTPSGTALITAFNPVQADLTSVGGPSSGTVLDSIVQEVDVRSGRVLFEWHSLDHVPLTDTYAPVLDPFDYFHVNSIDVAPDGSLIVSARNTSAVYKLDRKSGAVQWRLGGRSSDFALGPRAFFMYQHDARMHTDGTMTIFDDGPSSSSQQARGIRLGLDLGGMRADLLQEYVHPTPLDVAAMGNVQVLPGDALFVGWGTQPYMTEFGPEGDIRFDASFAGGAWNYRAFLSPWVGRPARRPALALEHHATGVAAYASWNGSTETAHWSISAGPARAALAPVHIVPAAGFETRVALPARTRYVQATALDAHRRPLASSAIVAA